MINLKNTLLSVTLCAFLSIFHLEGIAAEEIQKQDPLKAMTKRERDSLWIPVDAIMHLKKIVPMIDKEIYLPTKVFFDVMEDYYDQTGGWPCLDVLLTYISSRNIPWETLLIDKNLKDLRGMKCEEVSSDIIKKFVVAVRTTSNNNQPTLRLLSKL